MRAVRESKEFLDATPLSHSYWRCKASIALIVQEVLSAYCISPDFRLESLLCGGCAGHCSLPRLTAHGRLHVALYSHSDGTQRWGVAGLDNGPS